MLTLCAKCAWCGAALVASADDSTGSYLRILIQPCDMCVAAGIETRLAVAIDDLRWEIRCEMEREALEGKA